MIIQSKQKRTYLTTLVISLIPDIVICMAVSVYFDFGLLEFALTMVGLQIVYFAIWLKNTIWGWIHFKVRGKKIMVEHLESSLKINKFPGPQDFEDSIESYMNSVAENEELDPVVRIKAGAELGIVQYLIASQKAQELLMLTIAYEEALSNFKRYIELRPSVSQIMDATGL